MNPSKRENLEVYENPVDDKHDEEDNEAEDGRTPIEVQRYCR